MGELSCLWMESFYGAFEISSPRSLAYVVRYDWKWLLVRENLL